jgi:hypothetical protein
MDGYPSSGNEGAEAEGAEANYAAREVDPGATLGEL